MKGLMLNNHCASVSVVMCYICMWLGFTLDFAIVYTHRWMGVMFWRATCDGSETMPPKGIYRTSPHACGTFILFFFFFSSAHFSSSRRCAAYSQVLFIHILLRIPFTYDCRRRRHRCRHHRHESMQERKKRKKTHSLNCRQFTFSHAASADVGCCYRTMQHRGCWIYWNKIMVHYYSIWIENEKMLTTAKRTDGNEHTHTHTHTSRGNEDSITLSTLCALCDVLELYSPLRPPCRQKRTHTHTHVKITHNTRSSRWWRRRRWRCWRWCTESLTNISNFRQKNQKIYKQKQQRRRDEAPAKI